MGCCKSVLFGAQMVKNKVKFDIDREHIIHEAAELFELPPEYVSGVNDKYFTDKVALEITKMRSDAYH